MDEPRPASSAIPCPVPALGRGDLYAVLLLVLLAVGMRFWQVRHTEVMARDSIGYIRTAWQFEHRDWREVVRHSPQHPGYPASILAVSGVVRRYVSGDAVELMQLSAQLASSLASVLLMVPLFLAGRELFDRRISFWAALLFQALPAAGRLMADGLSEPLFLLFAVTSLWLGMRSLRTGSVAGFVGSGLAGGLAYLVRPEGAVVVLSIGLVLVGMQGWQAWRRGWGRCLACGVGLSAGTLALVAPFMLLIGHFTTKVSPIKMLDKVVEAPAVPVPVGIGSVPLASSLGGWELWGDFVPTGWEKAESGRFERIAWAGKILGYTLMHGFFYVAWVPVLLGLWWYRGRFRTTPAAWVLLVQSLLLTALLYRLARFMGYLSDRHAVLTLLAGCFWAVAALDVLGRWLAVRVARWRPALAHARWLRGRAWSLALMALLTLPPLVRSLEHLHGDRAGFRQAGTWLAQHTLPGDRVVDPYSWSHFYAGRVFVEDVATLPRHEPLTQYVVLEEPDRSPHLRLQREVQGAKNLARSGRPVQSWKVGKGSNRVVVYEVPWDGRYDEVKAPPPGSHPAAE
jgi:hypothetical protein